MISFRLNYSDIVSSLVKLKYSKSLGYVRKVRKVSKDQIIWYPGHINRGIEQLNQKLTMADVIIEVHDSRIPFTGRTELLNTFGQVKPKLLILNKIDLISEKDVKAIKSKIENYKQNDDGMSNIVFAQLNDHARQFKLFQKINDKLLSMLSTRSHNKAENHILVTGIPNVGKSTFINGMRNWNYQKFGYSKARSSKPTAVGPHAGVTRSVSTKILISEGPPRIYILDSPGIWEPSKENLESVLKMALCGCFDFDSIDKEIIIDYLLYWMNRHGHLGHVELYNMPDTTDDIVEFAQRVCSARGLVTKANKAIFGQEFGPQVIMAYERVFRDFNSGALGKLMLDDLDDCDESSTLFRNRHSVPLGTIISSASHPRRRIPFIWEGKSSTPANRA